jgi:gamma-glutamylcysteine synthetase
VTKTPSALPSPTTDGVDRMYRQLVEIHGIAAAQLEDCACWVLVGLNF